MDKSLTEKAIQNLTDRISVHERRFHLMTSRGRKITNSYEIALRFDQAKALLRYVLKLKRSNLGEWQIVPAGHKVRKGDMVWVGNTWEPAEGAIGGKTGKNTTHKSGILMWKTKRVIKRGRR